MRLSKGAFRWLGLALLPGVVGCFDGFVDRRPTLPRQPGIQPVVSRPFTAAHPPVRSYRAPAVLTQRHEEERGGFAVAKAGPPKQQVIPPLPDAAGTKSSKGMATTLDALSPPPPDPVKFEEKARFEETSAAGSVTLPPQSVIPPLPGAPPLPPKTPPVAKRQAPPAADPMAPPPIPSVVSDNDAGVMHPPETAKLRKLHEQAADQYAKMDSYIARLRRREQVNGIDRPEELILFKFRKQPWSVYFKWLGIEGRGREVVYVKDHFGDKIHSLLAAGDIPLMPAGKQMSIAPDSIFVRSASRHAITEAGLGDMIEQFGRAVRAIETNGDRAGTMKYLGQLKRPEFEEPVDAVEQLIPAGQEALLKKGGTRTWLFDTKHHLPVLLITTDHTGHQVEYYCYDRLQFPVKLDSDDFDPNEIWRKRKPAK